METRNLIDSELNVWIKALPHEKKKDFLNKIWNSKLMWASNLDKEQKKRLFNNYRYKNVAEPNHASRMIIYIIALSIDPELLISEIFPNEPAIYIECLLPVMKEFSNEIEKAYAKN